MRRLRRISRLFALSLTGWASGASLAAPLWSDFSGAFVAGSGFTLDPDKQRTVSLEYASGYGWGDTFTYLDTTFFRGDERTYSLSARRRRGGRSWILIKTGPTKP